MSDKDQARSTLLRLLTGGGNTVTEFVMQHMDRVGSEHHPGRFASLKDYRDAKLRALPTDRNYLARTKPQLGSGGDDKDKEST